MTLPRPVSLLAPPWLCAPSALPWSVITKASRGSLFPLALPWSIVTLVSPLTSGSLAAPQPSTPFRSTRIFLPSNSALVLTPSGITSFCQSHVIGLDLQAYTCHPGPSYLQLC